MKRHLTGVLSLLLVLVIPVLSQSQTKEATASFLELSYDLWKRTEFGWNEKQTERAAWLIRDKDRQFRWIEWDYSDEYRASTWKGEVPNHLIALIHTHPQHADPEPSKQDRNIARQLKVPVYAISGLGIWMVSPEGKITKEAGDDWYTRVKQSAKKSAIE